MYFGKTCFQCNSSLKKLAPCLKCNISFWEMHDDPKEPYIAQLTKDQIQTRVDCPFKLHFATVLERPGLSLLMTELEYRYFHPNTALNDFFEVFVVVWDKQLFHIVSVPLAMKEITKNLAKKYELRLIDGYLAKARFKDMPAIIESALITVPRKYLSSVKEWAWNRFNRLVGKRVPFENITIKMFPLTGPTLHTVEAIENASKKWHDREKEIREHEHLKKVLSGFYN